MGFDVAETVMAIGLGYALVFDTIELTLTSITSIPGKVVALTRSIAA